MAITARIINQKLLENAIVQAFETWLDEDVNKTHWDEQFGDKKWKWRSEPLTERENGELAGNPRDLYDLGNLYESGIKNFKVTKSTSLVEATWHWDAKNRSEEEYAWYVHEGEGPHSPRARRFTDDISMAATFNRKAPGKALKLRLITALSQLNAN